MSKEDIESQRIDNARATVRSALGLNEIELADIKIVIQRIDFSQTSYTPDLSDRLFQAIKVLIDASNKGYK